MGNNFKLIKSITKLALQLCCSSPREGYRMKKEKQETFEKLSTTYLYSKYKQKCMLELDNTIKYTFCK